MLFAAVQFLDVFWALLSLRGIERVRIVLGVTASNPLDLYYMPYTHSLAAAVLWSWRRSSCGGSRASAEGSGPAGAAATVVAGAVLSHWISD